MTARRSTSSSSTDAAGVLLTTPRDADGPELLEVGHIGRAHGVRGEVQVKLTTDRIERVQAGSVLYADDQPLTVLSSRPHQKGHIVAFDGVVGRDAAEVLRGATLRAEPIDDPAVLWVHELIGSRIEDTGGVAHGVVTAVEANPASDLLVADTGALVPLTFVVDQRDGVVVIDPPAGLFDIAGPSS